MRCFVSSVAKGMNGITRGLERIHRPPSRWTQDLHSSFLAGFGPGSLVRVSTTLSIAFSGTFGTIFFGIGEVVL